MLKRAIIARTLHKWLGLFVGLQILIWLGSGLYMVVVNIDFIHGDTLVRNMHQAVAVPQNAAIDMANLRSPFDHVTDIKLIPVTGKTFYAVTSKDERYLLDPDNGEIISPLGEDTAIEIARYHFNGNAEVINATLISSDPPTEIQTRRFQYWRISDFM